MSTVLQDPELVRKNCVRIRELARELINASQPMSIAKRRALVDIEAMAGEILREVAN